ncbi:MAG TPA: phosphoribosylformylglycinamidine synthase subunit PurL [Candidatus Limnocylindrales bacterium]
MTIAEPPTAVEEPLHRRLGVTDDELEAIRDRLGGRDPNELELAMFSVMWSEHCSYKSSRPLLRTLPTGSEADGVVAGPGENAGVISIGDGLAVAFKIESHNHPSAVEPTQGAATGVGGILRDIFTMGARPIAVLDALRFGDPADARTRHLVDGVVKGVGGYGNCVGVPTIGGELVFDPSYQGNPLVNVMAIGLLEEADLTRAAAPGVGNLVVLFGSTTGRDGIGGASVLASATFADADPAKRPSVQVGETSDRGPAGASPRSSVSSKRPSVQVGDPFNEKLLIEASLELIRGGLVAGLQDLGAGGITCATSETADRAGTGMRIELAAIPRREPAMEPFEVMISESQERMLAIVEPDRWEAVRAVCERWGLPVAVIGRVTGDGDVTIVGDEGTELARIPASALTSDAIVHDRVAAPPVRRRAAPAPGVPDVASDGLPERGMDPGAVLVALLGSANLASRRAIFEQYDSTVQANTVEGPGHGAAVVRIKGTTMALVASTDANQAVGALDPWLGAALSVAEATRNVAITGARPLGVTNCLNYGDPTRPEAFWQLTEGVRGLADACRALGLPVTGGNVSLYNESSSGAIAPTPEIGVVGLLEDVSTLVRPGWRGAGDRILLVGEATPGLAGSAYAELAGLAAEDGPPSLDLERERAIQAFVREAAVRGMLASAQDVSGGGLAVSLAECCLWADRDRGLGAFVRLPVASSPAVDLFGESPSRLVVSAAPRHVPALVLLARQHGLPIEEIGEVGITGLGTGTEAEDGDAPLPRLVVELHGSGATGAAEDRGSRVADALIVGLDELRHASETGLSRALGWETR